MTTTVLSIDDDPAITELLSILLRSHGFEVFTANNSEEGLRLIKEQNPGIVILDLMMPGMDGWQVCRTVRTFSNVPILILSALNDPGMVASALDAGADDYLVKPVPSAILVAHLNKLIRRTGTLNPPAEAPAWQPGNQPLTSTSS